MYRITKSFANYICPQYLKESGHLHNNILSKLFSNSKCYYHFVNRLPIIVKYNHYKGQLQSDYNQFGSTSAQFSNISRKAAFETSSKRRLKDLNTMKFEYPNARRDESVVDEYHGVKIKDPYRWLEDPDSEETKQFVDAQNEITQPFLEKCAHRSQINEYLTKYWNYPKYSCPYRYGDKYFFYMNTGLQNQSVFYVQDSLEGEPKVFLDPNTLSEDGTVALSGKAFSEDDKILAYGLSQCGSDWITIHFKNVDSGENFPEVLEKVKCSSMAWTHDNKGIFYGRYPDQVGKSVGSETESSKNQKLYYHLLGTPQSQDVLVAEFPEEPSIIIGAEVSDCGRWLLITPRKDCKDNLLYFADLQALPGGKITDKLKLTPVVTKFEADYETFRPYEDVASSVESLWKYEQYYLVDEYITNEGPVCIFRTNKDAPNYRLIKINLEAPSPDRWETLVPQHGNDVLDWASGACQDKLVLCYIHDVKNILQVHDLNTGKFLKTLPLDMGTITGYSGKRKYSEIFYQFTSFLSPGIIYRCDLSKSELVPSVFREMKVAGFDPSQYETKQVFYSSKDKTKVPMFIIHRKGVQKNGKNPVLLYGYGGFNVSLQPSFSVTRLVFIHHLNGVLAVPNLRGGGEYGERWHDAGRLFNKQNVFDDFHAAAEWLVAEGYTSSERLSIQGGSNGGLLVAACINQRPELYKAAVAQVGVLDMLRFHKFTIGCMWVSDYGSSDDPKHFDYLLKYSPLHNIKEPEGDAQYPATLLMTADHDDRVVPLHSLKFVAALQHTLRTSTKQTNPILIRLETKAGHGRGKPTAKVIEESTDMLCFLQLTLGLKFSE